MALVLQFGAMREQRKVAILHLVDSLHPNKGGPIECIYQTGIGLQSRGHRVEVVCFDRPTSSWLRDAPIPVHAIGPSYLRYAFCPRLLPWLDRYANDYDFLIVNGLWQFYGLGAWLHYRKVGKPFYVYAHGHLDPWTKKAYPWKHLKKSVYWHLIEKRIARDARGFLFTSPEEARLAQSYFRSFPGRSVVVGNGIAAPPVPTTEAPGIFARYPEIVGKRIVLFVGRLHPKKGVDLLIRAFAEFCCNDPRLHLLLVGPNEEDHMRSLTALVETMAMGERVTFAGRLGGNDKWQAFRVSEVFVLPSHQENFGIAVVEALASGIPVIVSDKVNIWRELRDDGAGFVCYTTAESVLAAMQAWDGLSEDRKTRMREDAKRTFERRFRLDATVRRLEQEYLTPAEFVPETT